MLTIENLVVQFGSKLVISDLTLSAPEHRVTALVGANGAGKSTILRAVARLAASASGSVRFRGYELLQCSALMVSQIGVVYLMQRGAVFSSMTVWDNLSLASGRKSPDVAQLSQVPCPGSNWPALLQRRAGELSMGQQRALAIAMLLARRPVLALLDEPFAGLALPVAEALAAHLRRLTTEQALTVVLVEHNLHLAAALADHVYLVKHGNATQLRQGIPPIEISQLLAQSTSSNPADDAIERKS